MTLPFLSVMRRSVGRRGSRVSLTLRGLFSAVVPKSMSDHLCTVTLLSLANLTLCPVVILYEAVFPFVVTSRVVDSVVYHDCPPRIIKSGERSCGAPFSSIYLPLVRRVRYILLCSMKTVQSISAI